jgi:cytochrome c oxidase subunit IV
LSEKDERQRARTGWWVFAGLAVLTAAEFALSAIVRPALPWLILTAILKAGLIVIFFMHIGQLRHQGRAE